MRHTIRDQQKLVVRTRRLRGQLEAIERALEAEVDCEQLLQQITACRGALNGLLAAVIEHHVRSNIRGPSATLKEREQLLSVIHSYLK